MKVLFLSHYFFPHVGGVEKHVYELSQKLRVEGCHVTVVTQQYDLSLKSYELVKGVRVVRFSYPPKKLLGIIHIWIYLWQHRKLIFMSDIVHIHDVFIWYLPFRLLFPTVKVFVTIHGLEWNNPFSRAGVWQKWLAVKFSKGSIGIGSFLEKYLNVKFDVVSYGAVRLTKFHFSRIRKNSVVFVGRLDEDTGILEFLGWIKKHLYFRVDFVGDGKYRGECKKYGTVYGFRKPNRFVQRAEYVVPGGYLACLEAMAMKRKIKVFWSNNLKQDYWQLSPMYKFILGEDPSRAYRWVMKHSWENLAKEYVKLWKK